MAFLAGAEPSLVILTITFLCSSVSGGALVMLGASNVL
jgi:hypothetical protein